MATLFGTITIGQAPRPDVTPVVEAHVPAHVARMHVGLLDGMNEAQIAARYAPRLRERRLLTRLLNGPGGGARRGGGRNRRAAASCTSWNRPAAP